MFIIINKSFNFRDPDKDHTSKSKKLNPEGIRAPKCFLSSVKSLFVPSLSAIATIDASTKPAFRS